MTSIARSYITEIKEVLHHITTRSAGGEFIFGPVEKEYFLKLLQKFSRTFFVRIHTFCIMDNHFHLLISFLEKEAQEADDAELMRRYKILYPNTLPPEGPVDHNGNLIKKYEGGAMGRLRERLSSMPDFMKELKQNMSIWYNGRKNRVGTLWCSRYKSTVLSTGEAQLVNSAYIDLNPVRAGIVKLPEEYRYSGIGLRVNSPEEVRGFLYPLALMPLVYGGTPENELDAYREVLAIHPFDLSVELEYRDCYYRYREFLYVSGGVEVSGKARIAPEIVDQVVKYHGHLGIGEMLCYRVRNFTEGIALGTADLIEGIQKKLGRKVINPRRITGAAKDCEWLYATRDLSKTKD